MRWTGHVACMQQSRYGYRILVGKPEVKRLLDRPIHRWEDNIKMDLRELVCDADDCIDAQDRGAMVGIF